MCCSVVAVRCSALQCAELHEAPACSMWCIAVLLQCCCSVAQYVAVCCSVLQCIAVRCSVLDCMRRSFDSLGVLQCVALCYSVL